MALNTPKYNSAVLSKRFCCSYAKSASAASVKDFDLLKLNQVSNLKRGCETLADLEKEL